MSELINPSDWLDPLKKKPTDPIFWALTMGRKELGERDWEIIKIRYDGEYRSLDFAASFFLPDTFNGQSWCNTIFAWLPLSAIRIDDDL